MEKKRKICTFVGSRANYSSCKSVMTAIQANPHLELQTIVGGSALLERFGNIESLIERDGFQIDAKFYMIIEGQNPVTMAKSTGLGIIEIAMILNNLNPDIMLVVGDRFDVMAPVVAAAYMNIPIVHTMGGEVSGTIDESVRHAITKMAHVHFPANEDARQRIIRLGENPGYVFNVGCPRIDLVREYLEKHRNGDRIDQDLFFKQYKGVGAIFDLEKESFLLVSQHPVTTDYGMNRKYIEETLYALREIAMPTIMIWPNVDAGSDEVSKGIRHFREIHRPDWLHLFINLPISVYVKLMDLCACMVGNSSSAIREGSFIGVRAVNIGTRQRNRMRGNNVLDVDNDKNEIIAAIRHMLNSNRSNSEYVYGDGNSGKKIATILANFENIDAQKCIMY